MKRLVPVLSLLVLVALSACGGSVKYAYTKQVVYTQTNLHVDERGQIWSTNYIDGSVLPRCTQVMIDRVTRKQMSFTIQGAGSRHAYLFHTRSLNEDIPTHLNRYFAPACDTAKIEAMGEADKAGIRDGKVYAGMTKDGVVLAVGYPPAHRTPSLDADTWVYWKTRYATLEVIFVDGAVQFLRE
jgi:hypothetical protein